MVPSTEFTDRRMLVLELAHMVKENARKGVCIGITLEGLPPALIRAVAQRVTLML